MHSSADLYGSDRSLLDFVAIHGAQFEIVVVLAEDGPLAPLLQNAGAKVDVGDVCKVQRSMFSVRGFARAVSSAVRSLKLMKRLAGDRGFDVVYSNTVAVLGGALYAKLTNTPHVWHIREIVANSPKLASVFKSVVGRMSDAVICNSNQTREWIKNPGSEQLCRVVWNGVRDSVVITDVRNAERMALGVAARDILFVMVGRINNWKGQGLLVDAFCRLRDECQETIRLVMVGSAYRGQEHYEDELRSRIQNCRHPDAISMLPFRDDIEAIWQASDVVVVPSTEPEPFGRVAIEAMAYSRPVIAAAHGGLIDIVVHEETGLLFEPKNPVALCEAMRQLTMNWDLRMQMGERARHRQRSQFSVQAYADGVAACLTSVARA